MKKYMLLLILSFQASAVVINPKGVGEFLLVPYYTVNNGLNTLVSIVNTTDRAKAVKIIFREGLNGHAVLGYNVYLEANDTWTFGLVPDTSPFNGFIGQPSALHLTSDESCAPFLDKSGQQFLPFELSDGPQNMQRVREGYIEIIEMAEVRNTLADTLGFTGDLSLSDNCSAISDAWASGFWPNDIGETAPQQMDTITGGLMAEASVIDVAEGISYPIPVTALADLFADGTIAHSSPGDTGLSLNAAKPEATVITLDGALDLNFENGTDAASAVFMTDELTTPYDLLSILAARSDTLFIQPTRRFYLNNDNITADAPFPATSNANNCDSDTYGGSSVSLEIYDRENEQGPNIGSIPAPEEGICGTVFVHSMSNGAQDTLSTSALTGSANFNEIVVDREQLLSESGVIKTFLTSGRFISATTADNDNVQIWGLPLLGVSLQKYTNANAGPGLLAQYGSAHSIISSVRIETEE